MASRRKKKAIDTYQMATEGDYLDEGECPECGRRIEWIRESGNGSYNADCRKCMVIWNATPQSVVFEVTGREAKLSQYGAMVFADR